MSATILYTPEVLALTIELAGFTFTNDLRTCGEARSKSCGSSIALGFSQALDGSVAKVGVRSQACAIGQAAAAIFALAVQGKTPADIIQTQDEIARWLKGEGGLPAWPRLDAIAAARDYPARHGAVLLPWNAALVAFAN